MREFESNKPSCGIHEYDTLYIGFKIVYTCKFIDHMTVAVGHDSTPACGKIEMMLVHYGDGI